MNSTQIMTKVAAVAPDKYAFIVKAASVIRESPFRDETLQELDQIMSMAKTAGFWQGAKTVGMGMGAAVGTAIAVSLAGDMFEASKRGLTKGINYRRMMRENPDLHEQPAREVQQSFATLHRFNPDFSADPMVAGTYVRKAVGFADAVTDTQTIGNLVQSRKNLSDTRKLPMMGKLPWDTGRERQMHDMQMQEHGRKGQMHEQNMSQGKTEHDMRVATHSDQMDLMPLQKKNLRRTAIKTRLESEKLKTHRDSGQWLPQGS